MLCVSLITNKVKQSSLDDWLAGCLAEWKSGRLDLCASKNVIRPALRTKNAAVNVFLFEHRYIKYTENTT